LAGPTGPTGIQGETGPPGEQGPIGPKGIKGDRGKAGKGLTLGSSIGQMLYWNGNSWDTLRPGSQGQGLLICEGRPAWSVLGKCPGKIANFQCGNFTRNGTLIKGRAVVDTWISIPYSGGNEGGYETLSMPSTNGISGLTATVPAGYFASGEGSLYAYISGTPSDSGTASFELKLGGQTCQLNFPVLPQAGVSSLNCSSATLSGSIFAWTSLSGYSVSLPYSGGNGGVLDAQSIQSTGVNGLTASLSYDTLSNGDGQLDFQISGFPEGPGTAIFPISIRGISCNLSIPVVPAAAAVGSIICPCLGSSKITGHLKKGEPANGVSMLVSYNESNGGSYPSQDIASTGITGLTAHLEAGILNYGSGTLQFTITGTPQNFGKSADFVLDFGGKTCTAILEVEIEESFGSCGNVNLLNPELTYDSVFDPAGRKYKTIKIGAQTWMAENLRTADDYINCWMGGKFTNNLIEGCPVGWHLPSREEWEVLINFLGGGETAIAKMKSIYPSQGYCPYVAAPNNSSGLSLSLTQVAILSYPTDPNEPPPFDPSDPPCRCDIFPGETDSLITIGNQKYLGGWWTSDAQVLVLESNNNFFFNNYALAAGARCIKNASASDTASIENLICANASISGSFVAGTSVSEGSITIPYNGGNAGLYFGQSVSSQGVEGLTAKLAPGTLQQGNGSLQWIISGTPTSSGTASFTLSAGGKSCFIHITIP
jgi:hypothetical protein